MHTHINEMLRKESIKIPFYREEGVGLGFPESRRKHQI